MVNMILGTLVQLGSNMIEILIGNLMHIPSFLTNGLDSGIAALIGAFIGAGTSAFITTRQIGAEHRRASSQRIFDARREAYQGTIRLFHLFLTERGHGRKIGPGSEKAEQYAGFDVVGRVTLFCSREVNEKFSELMGLFDLDISGESGKRQKDMETIKLARNEVIMLMRRDLEIEHS